MLFNFNQWHLFCQHPPQSSSHLTVFDHSFLLKWSFHLESMTCKFTYYLFHLFYFNFYSYFYFQILDFSRGFISTLLFVLTVVSSFLRISSYLLDDPICNSSLTLFLKEIVQASCPSTPLTVGTKFCQTYYPKAHRIHFFLYNTLPLLIAIACPTYIPTVIIISQCVSPVSYSRMATGFCFLCQLQLMDNGSSEYYFEKGSKHKWAQQEGILCWIRQVSLVAPLPSTFSSTVTFFFVLTKREVWEWSF